MSTVNRISDTKISARERPGETTYEDGEPNRRLLRSVAVGEPEDDAQDEATHEKAQQRSRCEAASHGEPDDSQKWDAAVGAHPLADKAAREFGIKETRKEDSHAVILVSGVHGCR